MNENEILGFKYQAYEDDQLVIYRVVGSKPNDVVTLVNTKNNKPKYIKKDELKDNYIRLVPDAFMNIMLTDTDPESKVATDVYVCVNKATDLSNGITIPSLILRQNCIDYSRLQIGGNIYVGECIIKFNDSDIINLMNYESIDYSVSIALYIDDTIDSIINIIPNKVMEKINDVLKSIAKVAEASTIIKGYETDFKKLLINKWFIHNYRRLFNIIQVDWKVDLGKQSYNSEGDIVLNSKQKAKLENELRQYVSNVRVIKYDKDIDISNIVASPHVLISDADQIIYLIAYDIIADFPIDSDIAKAMSYK